MSAYKMLKELLQIVVFLSMFFVKTAAHADDAFVYLIDNDEKATIKYSGPTFEDNVAAMDTDKNGFADIYEVRVFLERKHGKGYQKEVLDKMEASADGKSCSTPFAKEMYIDKNSVDKTGIDKTDINKTSKVKNPN